MEFSINRRELPVPSVPKADSRKNYMLLFLFLWMFLVNIPNVQSVYPPFGEFYFREIMTALIMGLVMWRIIRCGIRSPALFVFFCLIALNTIMIALMSGLIDLSVRIQLIVRLLILLSSIVVIPNLIISREDVRKIFLFTMFMNATVALTGPLQDVVGVVPELYPYDGWELLNSRGFIMRYVSLLGDPNIGGMIGGLLPITILALPKRNQTVWLTSLLVWSSILVIYSQSFTGMLFLLFSLLVIWFYRKSVSGVYVILAVPLSVVILISILFSPDLANNAWTQISGVIRLYTSENFAYSLERPGVLPSTNLFMADLDFRLFAYLDVNDTLTKMLFGSTYNVVTPGAEYNPNAIIPHNSYKEMYLAGGLLQLGLYLTLLAMTLIKGFFLINSKRDYNGLGGVVIASYLIFTVMLFGLSTFPIYHYSGVGQILWVSVSIVNVVFDRSYSRGLVY